MEEIQLNSINKNQNGLEQSKNEKSSTLPRYINIILFQYAKLSLNQNKNKFKTQYKLFHSSIEHCG